MAVDAHNLLLSPPQFFSNREIFINNNTIMEPTSDGFYTNNNQTIYGVVSPFLDNTPRPPHMYGSADNDFSLLPTRKRSRDYSTSNYYYNNQNLTSSSSSSFSFLGQNIDISTHMNQQQHEIDRFVSLHMEKMRFEIEEKRKKQVRMIMEAIEQRLVKRLRVKEEEKERLQKVNNALEERVKSLAVENQIWRDIAQSNEATANNLRINLEQVLANVKDVQTGDEDGDDAESWCGSRTAEEEDDGERRKCRKCGEKESCVLLLPCRHLCLCGVCGSHVDTCPICASPKNASVHVNMSS